MKTCLGSLLLVPVILALIGTVIYHASVNQEARFEPRDTNAIYINTQRSYRPPIAAPPKRAVEVPHISTPQLRDDDTAEEVEP